MASKIQCPAPTAGVTVYALVRADAGTIWQTTTSTLVAYATANMGNYDLPMTQQGTASKHYTVDFPAAAAGLYVVSVYQQAGGSPAETDTLIGYGEIQWDGTNIIPLRNLPVNVTQWNSSNVATPDTAGYPKITVKSGTGTGEISLTSGVVSANMTQISGDATAADNAEAFFEGGFILAAVVLVVNTDEFDGSATLSATNDVYNGMTLVFTSGTLKGQCRQISDYVGNTRTFRFNSAFGSGEPDQEWEPAPTAGDTFIIIGRIG